MNLKLFFLFLLFFSIHMPLAHSFSFLDFEKANRDYQKGSFDKAQKLYEAILEKDSNRGDIHYNLGNTHYRNGKFPEAEKNYLESLNSQDPKIREDALYNLGNARYRQNDLQGALDYYNKALEMNPDNREAELNRDFVLKKMKEEPPPESKQDQKNQENQENQNTEEKNKDSQDQPQESPPKEQDQEKQEEKKQQDSSGTPEDQNEERTQKEDLSGAESEKWLDAVEDNPKGAIQDILRREIPPQDKKKEKDW